MNRSTKFFTDLKCPRCGKVQTKAHYKRKICHSCRIKELDSPRAKIMNRASCMVSAAVRKGVIVRQPCEVCGASKAQAHHDDYTKPLDVRWLCLSHHRRWHLENGPGKNPYSSPNP